MTTPPPPQPKIRSIVVGMLLIVVLVVMVCSAGSVVKWIGVPFLVVPRVLGALDSLQGRELVRLPMATSPTAVTFPRAETYLVYVGDIGLLEISETVSSAQAPPWLTVQRAETGESILVEPVRRGMMPFDEPRAPGRPVYRFTITEPGTYALSHPRREIFVALVPDRTTGKEGVIAAFFLAELALLALPFAIVLGRPWLRRRQAWRQHQRRRREASDAVMQRRSRGGER